MNNSLSSKLRVDLIGCWLLATLALCMGLVINQFRDQPLPLIYQPKAERLLTAVANLAAGPPEKVIQSNEAHISLPASLTLEEFKHFVDLKQGWILDARPEIFHRLGHVPGALALPRDDFEAYYRKHQEKLEAAKNQPLVIYCTGGSCEDSDLVASALRKLGYTQISVFIGGWAEWTRAGHPVETDQ